MEDAYIDNLGIPIMVSVCCLVYNHEPFLRECFEGFVMQQTTFPIEILVHDDASTDHSADIIREYTAKYPDLFKPIYQTENQYSKGKGFVGILLNFERAKGKYIAMCEGDDYWTDPLKLQKQVEFLEEHDEYVLSFHDATIIDIRGNIITESKISKFMTAEKLRDWTDEELMEGNTPPTPTVMYRKQFIDKTSIVRRKCNNLINGDTINASLIGRYGKGKYHSDIENSVCNVHEGGVWQMKSSLYKYINVDKTYAFLSKYHKKAKVVRMHLLKCRYNNMINILKYCINKRQKKIFIEYYFKALRLLCVMFDCKTIYVFNKDISYWIKNRKNG